MEKVAFVAVFVFVGLVGVIVAVARMYVNSKYKYFVCWHIDRYKVFEYTSLFIKKQFECPMETYIYSGKCIEDENITVRGCPRAGLLTLEQAQAEVITMEQRWGATLRKKL